MATTHLLRSLNRRRLGERAPRQLVGWGLAGAKAGADRGSKLRTVSMRPLGDGLSDARLVVGGLRTPIRTLTCGEKPVGETVPVVDKHGVFVIPSGALAEARESKRREVHEALLRFCFTRGGNGGGGGGRSG